jgi:outer membrane protein with beta-barrel domain
MVVRWRLVLALLLPSLPALAIADPPPASDPPPTGPSPAADPPRSRYGFGARLGGYGFRAQSSGNESWDDGRMDGMGVFGERRFGDHAFAELGVDFYSSTADAVSQEGLDRSATLVTFALGVRPFPRALLSPYLELGGGADFTRATATEMGLERSFVFPLAFVGAGGDLHLGDHLRVGAAIRGLLMDQFARPSPQDGLTWSLAPAAQLQLFARYDL